MASSRRRWGWGIAVVVAAATAGALALGVAARPRSLAAQGGQLFQGEQPLVARMAGHDQALPQEAVACSNCHELESAAFLSGQSFGPVLGPSELTRPQRRRGGPASTYTFAPFCRVLRDGIDPAHVMIPQTMPRYTLSEQECAALWLYLTEE